MTAEPVSQTELSASGESAAFGRRNYRRWIIPGLAFLVSLALAAALLELGTFALAKLGVLSVPAPTYGGAGFWDGDHGTFGVWHRPHASWRHQTACFDVTYETNAVGARDVERRPESKDPRVLVLGDSFVEGWGLPVSERLSNRLENATGIEHLNFGMAHFGPWQEYLSYREMGKKFSHTAVLVVVLPVNDFFDLDPELSRAAPWYEYRHRPYLVGSYPEYRSAFFREPLPARLGRRYLYSYNAFRQAFERRSDRQPEPPGPADPLLVHSFFYDFTDSQFDRLRYSLEKIVEEAERRPVAVCLVPSYRDLVRYLESGESPLSRRLKELAGGGSFRVVDLLPFMHDSRPDWESYYFACDYHWNALGNAVAAERLREELQGYVYEATGRPGLRS